MNSLTAVVGSTGYVGRHLVERLLKAGRRVRVVVREEGAAPAGAEVRLADLTRPDTLDAALSGAGLVYHCAAIVGNRMEPYPRAYDLVNRWGTANLAASAKQVGAGRLVMMSGLGIRPAPPGTYMATRWGGEEAVRRSGIPYVILQPSVLFGAGAAFVVELASFLRRYPAFPAIGGRSLHFQPLWIEDLVTCLVKAGDEPGLENREIPLGGSEILAFPEVIHSIAGALGKRRLAIPPPVLVARVQANLMARVMRNPPLTPAAVELFSFDNATQIDAVDRNFGFHPRGFTEHLKAHGLT